VSTGDVAGGNRIVGRITRCGRPAAGLRVQATGVLTIGIETDFKPCLKTTNTRSLGSATVAADGTYSITYAPAPPDVDFCAYSARVRVDVLEDGILQWRSPEQIERASVRFDRELFPGCTVGQSVVLVIDASRRPASGAEVFHNGNFVGLTNAQGSLVVASLAVGDRLVARKRLDEHPTGRDGHAEGSTSDWSHRSYSSSLRVLHDANGDNVELRQFVVTDPVATQRIQLSSLNSLITFNLLMSIEWDATALEIRRYTDRLLEMSELLYNATDGQFLVERVAVVDNRRFWDDADIRIYANMNQHSVADVGDLLSGSGRIHMNPNDSHEPGVTLHELGHYAFNVYDEYKAGPGWEESDGPHLCTFASEDSGTDFSAGGSKDSCLMRGARDAEIKKICSTHPANPHAPTTRQGLQDCWTEIVKQYGDPDWRLRTPASRGAIVDVLPDSGIPLATSTPPPKAAAVVASYIPVQRWKPAWHTSSVTRPGECPDLLVRVERNGSPRDNVKVWLASGSVTTYQGVTNAYQLPYGLSTGSGEIRLRGAHVGDWVSAMVWVSGFPFPKLLYGATQVGACGPGALVISLNQMVFPFFARLDPVGPGETRVVIDVADEAQRPAMARVRVDGADPISIDVPAAARSADASLRGRLTGLPERGRAEVELAVLDEEGREVIVRSESTFASLSEEVLLEVRSADGRFELALPPGAVDAPAGLVVETAVAVPSPPSGMSMVGDAYRVASSSGDRLADDARLEINLDVDANGELRSGRKMRSATIVRLAEGGQAWEALDGLERTDRFFGARTDQLGTFALLSGSPRPHTDHPRAGH